MWNFYEFLIRGARSQQNQPLHKAIVKSCPTNIFEFSTHHPPTTSACSWSCFLPGDFAQTFRLFLGAGMCFQTLVCSLDMLVHSFLEQQRNLYLLSLPQTITGIQIKGQCLESLKQRLEVFLFRAHLKIDCEQNEQNPEQWTSFRILPLLHPVETPPRKENLQKLLSLSTENIFFGSIQHVWKLCLGGLSMWSANLVFPFSPASPWEGARGRDATPPPGKPSDVRLFGGAGLYIIITLWTTGRNPCCSVVTSVSTVYKSVITYNICSEPCTKGFWMQRSRTLKKYIWK